MTRAPLVPGSTDSELALEEVQLAQNEAFTPRDPASDTLLFCSNGGGLLTLAEEALELGPRTAGLVLAGESATVTAGGDGLVLVAATAGSGADRHAPLGAREAVVPLDGAGQGRATGARSFQILFGPHNGSTRATLFMGFVPPGKAPWHYHLYDEIVWIPRGPGRLHRADEIEELDEGSAFRLRPRELHIVENTGSEVLEVLGVFSPAGSPSAAYLTPDVAASYAFSG
jgi:mannose-6-phosphate isomerase-like protein (cupin superfamily)